MIIGEALGELFKDLTLEFNIDGNIVSKDVKYHYGDYKELTKWIADKKGSKYPLVWYVTAKYKEEEPNDTKNVSTQIWIFQQTQVDWFNTKRTVKSYSSIIEPTWKAIKKLMEKNRYIDILGDSENRYDIEDKPSFGVESEAVRLSQNNLSSKGSTESVTLDVVDGRIININFRIQTNKCKSNGC